MMTCGCANYNTVLQGQVLSQGTCAKDREGPFWVTVEGSDKAQTQDLAISRRDWSKQVPNRWAKISAKTFSEKAVIG